MLLLSTKMLEMNIDRLLAATKNPEKKKKLLKLKEEIDNFKLWGKYL